MNQKSSESLFILHKAVAETIGVFFLVFAGCGSLMIADRFPGTIHPAVIPVVFGLAITVMIYAVGHISGAHFNPAVTLAFSVARHFPLKHIVFYWTAQSLGALAAMSALSVLLPAGSSFGATVPSVPAAQALGWETVFTFLLMFVIIAVATDTRAEGTMAGVAIGGTVMLGAFVGGPVTGGSMNPARSLAPAIFEGRLSEFWIYLAGPVLGAVLAALLYEWLRCDPSTQEKTLKSTQDL